VYRGPGVYRGPPEVYHGPCMKNMALNTQLSFTSGQTAGWIKICQLVGR